VVALLTLSCVQDGVLFVRVHDVPPGSLRAQAGVMEDGLVLPGPQTAKFEGLMLTTIEVGGDEGPTGPLLGPAGVDDLVVPQGPPAEGTPSLLGARLTCAFRG